MTNKRRALAFTCTMLLFGTLAFGKKKAVAPVNGSGLVDGKPVAAAVSAKPEPESPTAALDKVLTQMDQQAANFRNAQANFVWDQYTKVVDDHDLQEGVIYFRRLPKSEMQMAANIMKASGRPAAKIVLFTDGKVRLYEPAVDRVTEYDAGKNKAAFESFLVLGFGGGGHDMLKSFDVKYEGTEQALGVNAVKLDLTPKAPKVKAMFNHIVLWIDPARGVSVQQQFFDPDGNYRLAKYSNIKLNDKINDDVFKLKTTSKTTIVRPNG